MNDLSEKYTHIKGWGHDADPHNNPGYPMKNYTGADHNRLLYEREPQQPVNVEVLKSNERPTVSRVFGTSAPPSGLSGVLRRIAFRHSESTYAHWVPLVMADRIGVLEGYLDDISHGTMPHPLAERGLHAEWKYNRDAAITKLAVGAVVTAGLIYAFRKTKNRSKRQGLLSWLK